MDFSPKNRVPLADLQRALCTIVAPEVNCGGPGFALGAEDRDPRSHAHARRRLRNPVYDRTEHPDDEVKPFRVGLLRVLPADRLAVYSKVGWSYGLDRHRLDRRPCDRPLVLPRRHALHQRRRRHQRRRLRYGGLALSRRFAEAAARTYGDERSGALDSHRSRRRNRRRIRLLGL
jgi:hypothetical protein